MKETTGEQQENASLKRKCRVVLPSSIDRSTFSLLLSTFSYFSHSQSSSYTPPLLQLFLHKSICVLLHAHHHCSLPNSISPYPLSFLFFLCLPPWCPLVSLSPFLSPLILLYVPYSCCLAAGPSALAEPLGPADKSIHHCNWFCRVSKCLMGATLLLLACGLWCSPV